MRYLLDTHIVLWLAENSPKLPKTAISIILDDANEKYVSIASCWEVSIKLSLGKLNLSGGTSEFFRIIKENGFKLLGITEEYLKVLETMPFHHLDPFDRLLISTALANDLVLLSDDSQLQAYSSEALQIVS